MAEKTTSIQFSILGILGLIFITLKLTGHITWPWLWVLAPFWIPIGLVLVIFFVAIIIRMIVLR
jgi:hypothetical protein